MLSLFAFIISLVITMVLIPPLIKYASHIGAIDIPDERKVHQQAIARVGGIAMVTGSLVSMLLWLDLDSSTSGLLTGFFVLLVFGIWDDRSDLHYRIKFFGQLLAVLLVVLVGDVVVWHVPFIDETLPVYIAIPFTIFALVGITNAINLSDGLDGLAGGTTLLSLCVIGLLAYQADDISIVIMIMAVIGSVFGFLRHNTHPARVFMGDTGSQFLGLTAGVFVIVLTQDINSAVSPVLPLIILGLPILDTVAVMVQRIYEKRSPFSPDKNHIHHKLLAIGFDHYEAVFIIYIVQSLLVVSAYILKYESDALLFISYLFFGLTVLMVFHFSKKNNWKFHKTDSEQSSLIRQKIKWLRSTGCLTTGPDVFLAITLSLIFVISVIMPDNNILTQGIVILSVSLLALFILSFVVSKGRVTIFEKAVTYVVCVLSVYLLQGSESAISEYSNILNIVFILVAIVFAIKIRFAEDRSFQVTPLDFLVISVVIVVPNIPGLGFDEAHLGEMALKLIVMFYASEAILNAVRGRIALIRIAILSTLTLAVVRGLSLA